MRTEMSAEYRWKGTRSCEVCGHRFGARAGNRGYCVTFLYLLQCFYKNGFHFILAVGNRDPINFIASAQTHR